MLDMPVRADAPRRPDAGTTNLQYGKAIPPFAILRAFEAVGRLSGIRKAAAWLSLDHAVVSRHVRALEEWVGSPLFKRSGGRLLFTETGARYHMRISASLAELAHATSDLVTQTECHRVRLWSAPGLAFYWLSGEVAEFHKQNPGCEVELRPSDTAPDLHMLEADADLRFYGDSWGPRPGGAGMRHIELARPLSFPVASPELADRLSRLGSVAELAQCDLLHEQHCEEWRAWFRHNGIDITDRLPGQVHWHTHLAMGAAQHGLGVALANTFQIDRELQDGRLVEVKIPGTERASLGAYVFETRADRWSARPITQIRRVLQQRASAHHQLR
jgi:DNA-binding transcriptional LysR family regulator